MREKTSISYEEYLNTYGALTYTFRGVSMLPMLREGKDIFTVEKKTAKRCRKGDVVLYRRGEEYVLHRVIEVRQSDYIILGDNCINKEYGITDADILGVLTSFTRDGRSISVNDRAYRRYARRRVLFHPLRIGALRLRARAAAFLSKCPFLKKLWHRLKNR